MIKKIHSRLLTFNIIIVIIIIIIIIVIVVGVVGVFQSAHQPNSEIINQNENAWYLPAFACTC